MTRQTAEMCAADTRTDWVLVEETREHEQAVANARRALAAESALRASESRARDRRRK